MKKSRAVSIPLVGTLAAAALAAGCGRSSRAPAQQEGWQTCVDRSQNTAVDQRYCDEETSRSTTSGYMPHYGWYYFPRGFYWNAPGIGSRVPVGGTWGTQPFNAAPMARTGVVRGGFGSTGSGHVSTGS
jgi:hypothetical protein